jgi:hypothetical protein
MKSQSVKFVNDGRDPVGSYLDRLFLFWQCYVLEENLLADWHDSAFKYPGRPHHQLFESFLDAWGKDPWEKTNETVDFEKQSYFQALGVVSHRLIEQLQGGVLGEFLVKEGNTWSLRQDVSADAEKRAEEEIRTLVKGFDECRIPTLEKAKKEVEEEADSAKCGKDIYLDALTRMIDIEEKCGLIQAHFLKTGTVLPDSA